MILARLLITVCCLFMCLAMGAAACQIVALLGF